MAETVTTKSATNRQYFASVAGELFVCVTSFSIENIEKVSSFLIRKKFL